MLEEKRSLAASFQSSTGLQKELKQDNRSVHELHKRSAAALDTSICVLDGFPSLMLDEKRSVAASFRFSTGLQMGLGQENRRVHELYKRPAAALARNLSCF